MRLNSCERAALRKCRPVIPSWSQKRVMVVVGWSPLNVLECLNSSREIFWNCKLPMSMKSVFLERLPFQMCVSGVSSPFATEVVSHVVLVLPISAKLLACSQIGHLVVPYFFGLASYFVCFFRGVRGRKNPTSNWPNHQHGGGVAYQNDAGGIEASWRRWRCFLAGETPLNLHVQKGCCCKMISRGTIFNRIFYEGHVSTNNHAYELENAAENYNPWGEGDTHWRILLESGGSIQRAERCIESKVRSYVSHHFWQHIEIGWITFDDSSRLQFVSETNVGLQFDKMWIYLP